MNSYNTEKRGQNQKAQPASNAVNHKTAPIGHIQAKRATGQPSEELGHKVNQVVDQSASSSVRGIQRKCRDCEESGIEERIQKQAITSKDQVRRISTAPLAKSTDQTPTCESKGLSRRAFLNNRYTDKSMLGVTILEEETGVKVPKVRFKKEPEGWTLKPATASVQSSPSWYTDEGSYFEGRTLTSSPECKEKNYRLKWIITPQAAAKLKEGEEEHCNDYQYAFKVSLQAYANEINKVAGVTYFDSKQDAKEYIVERTGLAPEKWREKFIALMLKTNNRDDNHWHTPTLKRTYPNAKTDCKYAEALLDGSCFEHIGKHPSEEIIK